MVEDTCGRHLSSGDDVFDYATSYAGIQNIPDSQKVTQEIFRVLKPGGELLMMNSFVDYGSRTFDEARKHGLDRAYLESYLVEDLSQAGFSSIDSRIVASAAWSRNPKDLLPIEGDIQHFSIVRARK